VRRALIGIGTGAIALALAAFALLYFIDRDGQKGALLRDAEQIRGLVQRAALAVHRAAGTDAPRTAIAVLADELDTLRSAYIAKAPFGSGTAAGDVGRVDRALGAYAAALRDLAAPTARLAPGSPAVAALLAAASGTLAEDLDRHIRLLQQERAQLRTTVQTMQIGVLVAILALLVLGLFYVLRPLRRRAENAVEDVAQARAETAQAKAQLTDAIESMNEGVALFDAKDHLVLCNDKFREMFELAGATVMPGASFEAMIRAVAAKNLVADARGRAEAWVAERMAYRRAPTGPIKQYLVDGRCLQIAEYRTRDGGLISIQADITTTERHEAARRVSEERTRSIVDTVIDGIITLDADGNIETFNPAAERIFGYPAEDVLGTPFTKLLADNHAAEHAARLERFMDQGDFPAFSEIREVMGRKRNGGYFPLELAFSELRGTWTLHERRKSQRFKFIATLRDISNRKKLAAQLQQAQKMEAIGTLAGGIAHDFNNILSIILGYASLAVDELDGIAKTAAKPAERASPSRFADIRENLGMVIQAGKRARDLVQQILTFSRHSEPEKRPLDIQPIVKEVMKLMRPTLPATIEIKQSFERETLPVMADPSQIHQVLMNLCTNAAHAMEPNGGVLDVSLGRIDGSLAGEATGNGTWVRLVVRDTGTGMDEATRERIFEPFFTTKAAGEGTGLGLSVVHGIVSDHGGTILVESEPGKGSLFEVLLPVHHGAISADEEPEMAPPTGKGRVLFVDDEAPLVKMAERVLTRLGYSVVGETRSQAALDRFKADPRAFDVVITDQTMPGLTGDVLAGEVRKLRADIPIVLCTGNSAKLTPETASAIGINELVMKPLLADELGLVVSRALERAAPPT
jgi:PAS domain S-box-containing protein